MAWEEFQNNVIILDEVVVSLENPEPGVQWESGLGWVASPGEVELDRFSGTCLVATEPIVYTGKIVAKWVNKAPEGFLLPMPAAVKADGNTFEVGVSYRNDSTGTVVAGCEVRVTRPDGSVVAPAIDWTGMSPGETLSTEYNIAAVNQVGNWTIVIRFLALT